MNTAYFKQVELYYEPIEILNYAENSYAEMGKGDLGFLCGLIKKHRPKKVVEVGVAEGGQRQLL